MLYKLAPFLAISNLAREGFVVPMPTLPLAKMHNSSVPAFLIERIRAVASERLVVVSSRYAIAEAPSATAGNMPVRSVEL